MGLCLIATVDAAFVLAALQIAVGLGLVIFVHELGHFAVAKWCGVKCEKFYLGFDIWGLRLARFRWGETEYGIGILPLGGYVKMLGQEDNPARVAEEIERAKSTGVMQQDSDTTSLVGIQADGTPIYDPRSYLAKSVPQRMAIISAGVIMNVIFAFGLAMCAYAWGVNLEPCLIGGTVPGGPAWAQNLQSGDEILKLGNIERPFYRDIQSGVALGDVSDGIQMVVKRYGTGQVDTLKVVPLQGPVPMIGMLSQNTLKVIVPEQEAADAEPIGAQTEPPLVSGDEITAVEGQPVKSLADVSRIFAARPDDSLRLTIARTPGVQDNHGRLTLGEIVSHWFRKPQPQAAPETLEVALAPRPIRNVGLIMELGPIVEIQADSPAAKIGLRPGDLLTAINDESPGDPLTLGDRLRRRAGEKVKLTIQRAGEAEPLVFTDVELRPVTELFQNHMTFPMRQPVAISALGLAYEVHNRVVDVVPDSPAAKAGVPAGAVIAKVEFKLPKATSESSREPLELGDKRLVYPGVFQMLQDLPKDSSLVLYTADNQKYELAPVEVPGWHNPDRDLFTRPIMVTVVARSVGEAFSLAATETKYALLQVYRFLGKLGTQIDIRMLGGPITIVKVAKQSADKGLTDFLLFLTMLSANLAVINFLPIPILDGGHMVFLALEWIRGKPVGENIVLAFHYAGFLFIVSLMLFVFGLDLGLFSRGL
ncbi:MAG: site-2 protease family protein [Pirellulales bacterium]|nr:site-2 protease family protein [Pirellulales bacterium]